MSPLELADPPAPGSPPGRRAGPRRPSPLLDVVLRAAAGLALLQLIVAVTAYVLSRA